MPHGLQLGHLGQQRRTRAAQRLGQHHVDGGRGVLRVGTAARRGMLEDQFFMHGFHSWTQAAAAALRIVSASASA